MRHFLTAIILAAVMIGASPARAITPVVPLPPYTAQELAVLKSKAKGGDAGAQSTLGLAYLYGQRIDKDEKMAWHWLNLAAVQNDGAAEEAVGQAHLDGKMVPASKPAALDWFKRAVSHGQVSAREWADELTREQDTYLKLQAAAHTGDAAAEYAFAAYMPPEYPGYGGHGWGDEDAIKWYRLSAHQGYAPAEAWMGFYYLMGYIRDKSGPTAPHATWEADNDAGVLSTGKIKTAAFWYEKAAAQGNEEAIHLLPVVYSMSLDYSAGEIETAMRASALRTPPAKSVGTRADAVGHVQDDLAIDTIRQHIFGDLGSLCAWYDGQSITWRDNHLTSDVQVIQGQPQPEKALQCYGHQGDIGFDSGAYIVAYRVAHQEKPDLTQVEADYTRVWDITTTNAGLVTRAAAHIGLLARDHDDRVSAYAWLTMAGYGDMMAVDSNDPALPTEPDLATEAAGALKALKLTAAQKAEGGRQVRNLSATHPPPPPPPPFHPPAY